MGDIKPTEEDLQYDLRAVLANIPPGAGAVGIVRAALCRAIHAEDRNAWLSKVAADQNAKVEMGKKVLKAFEEYADIHGDTDDVYDLMNEAREVLGT